MSIDRAAARSAIAAKLHQIRVAVKTYKKKGDNESVRTLNEHVVRLKYRAIQAGVVKPRGSRGTGSGTGGGNPYHDERGRFTHK